MSEHKKKNVFLDGPITPQFIADSIAHHSSKYEIGAHSIFLGQIRNDLIDGKHVKAIEYNCYPELAVQTFHEIREAAFEKYKLTCMHIYHSLGVVEAGQISLFVFTSSQHRADAIDAASYIVHRIKSEVPVWGKELFEDDTYQWKKQLNNSQ
jgi:molybdopterin synthase catalytic subunit